MELTSNTGAGTNDRPPDPAAAQAAAREARRRLIALRWPLYLWMGLSAVPSLLLTPASLAFVLYYLAWVFAAYGFGLFVPDILKWLTRRRGGYALQAQDALVAGGLVKGGWRRLLLFWLPLLASFLIPDPFLGVIFSGVYFTCLFVWSGTVLCLWEPYFAAAVTMAAGILLAAAILTKPSSPEEMIMVLPVVVAMIGIPWGVSFFFRWRRWLRSLPPEEPGTGAAEARP